MNQKRGSEDFGLLKPPPTPEALEARMEEMFQLIIGRQNEIFAKLEMLDARIDLLINSTPKPASRKKSEPSAASTSAQVWQAFVSAHKARYPGSEPLSNAKVYSQCKQIIDRVGLENAVHLAHFYHSLNDSELIRLSHPIGMLLMKVDTIWDRFKTGRNFTNSQALAVERDSANNDAVSRYLAKARGEN